MLVPIIDEVVFDGSTKPGKVILNGFEMSFASDIEAKAVFDTLIRAKDQFYEIQKTYKECATHFSRGQLVLDRFLQGKS